MSFENVKVRYSVYCIWKRKICLYLIVQLGLQEVREGGPALANRSPRALVTSQHTVCNWTQQCRQCSGGASTPSWLGQLPTDFDKEPCFPSRTRGSPGICCMWRTTVAWWRSTRSSACPSSSGCSGSGQGSKHTVCQIASPLMHALPATLPSSKPK
jgi:hypothetical protein